MLVTGQQRSLREPGPNGVHNDVPPLAKGAAVPSPALRDALGTAQARLLPPEAYAGGLVGVAGSPLVAAQVAGLEAALERAPKTTLAALRAGVGAALDVAPVKRRAGKSVMPDHARAFRAAVDAHRSFSVADSRFSMFCPSTNEWGLTRAAATPGARGGAVIGVSGGILDIGAAMKADAIVSADLHGGLADYLLLVVGALLIVDKKVRGEGLSDGERPELVCSALIDFATIEALREWAPRAKDVAFEQVLPPYPGPGGDWIRGQHAVEHVKHLTDLALEGRILTVTASLTDARYAELVNRVVKALGAPISAINVSNAFDYINEPLKAAEVLAALKVRKDAVVFSTADHPDWFVRGEGYRVGSFSAPAITPHADFVGPGGTASLWHETFERAYCKRKP